MLAEDWRCCCVFGVAAQRGEDCWVQNTAGLEEIGPVVCAEQAANCKSLVMIHDISRL